MLNQINLERIDLNLLVVFEAVLAECHVGRAAERLNLTASAVSHGLGRLRKLFNDPLFIRTPKGVMPTARAIELNPGITDILARVRSVVASADPFDPASSARRFTIGAPDGVSAVFLPPLLAELRQRAPGLNIAIKQLLPAHGETLPERAWRNAFSDLEERAMDIAVIPYDQVPARFQLQTLYVEDFVIAMRARHPSAVAMTLDNYCDWQHLVVSLGGDPHGFVDQVLAEQGKARRIALTVPNFMLALALVAETDLIAAVPRQFAQMHAARFEIRIVEVPLPLRSFPLNAVVPKAALMDQGIAWLFETLGRALAVTNEDASMSRRPRGVD